jgi:hypothetical protein
MNFIAIGLSSLDVLHRVSRLIWRERFHFACLCGLSIKLALLSSKRDSEYIFAHVAFYFSRSLWSSMLDAYFYLYHSANGRESASPAASAEKCMISTHQLINLLID